MRGETEWTHFLDSLFLSITHLQKCFGMLIWSHLAHLRPGMRQQQHTGIFATEDPTEHRPRHDQPPEVGGDVYQPAHGWVLRVV